MNAKKYYWLKLNKDFFNQKEIKKLRRIAGGDTYTIIYLKLQLLSVTDEGKLFYEGIEDDFAEELALELDEDVENVKVTLMFLEKHGLIESYSDTEYVLPKALECIGSESTSAARVRKHREKKESLTKKEDPKQLPELLHCNTSVTEGNTKETRGNSLEIKCNTEKSREEIELDIEKDKEIDKNNNNNKQEDKNHVAVSAVRNQIDIKIREYGLNIPGDTILKASRGDIHGALKRLEAFKDRKPGFIIAAIRDRYDIPEVHKPMSDDELARRLAVEMGVEYDG